MTNYSGVWETHPDLETEWNELIADSKNAGGNDLTADLWMNFWRAEAESSTKISKDPIKEVNSNAQGTPNLADECNPSSTHTIPKASEEMEVELQAIDVTQTESQAQQIKLLASDLIDALEMEVESIPEELKEDMCSLPANGMLHLLAELECRLSDQTAHSFCLLLCSDVDVKSWMNVALVFEVLFLPKLRQGGLKSLPEELQDGLKQLTKHFPTESVSSFMKPLLASELKSPSHLQILSGLVSLLPEKEFIYLLRSFICQCQAPIQEWEINILNCLLSGVRANTFGSKTESPLLDLVPVLTSSVRSLSGSESFTSLLLNVIPVLKKSTQSRTHNELTAIVQLMNSFDKQALVDALET